MPEIITLEIYSWAGISIGAIHYYGDLSQNKQPWKSVKRIKHPITEKQAVRINEHVRRMYAPEYAKMYSVKPGDIGYGYDTEQDVIDEAIKQWRTHFPDGDVLVDYKNKSKIYAKRGETLCEH